tara:strand:+ start:122 stop:334 length:213 start_codon:yes stop_codon:yes gene_type:complete
MNKPKVYDWNEAVGYEVYAADEMNAYIETLKIKLIRTQRLLGCIVHEGGGRLCLKNTDYDDWVEEVEEVK